LCLRSCCLAAAARHTVNGVGRNQEQSRCTPTRSLVLPRQRGVDDFWTAYPVNPTATEVCSSNTTTSRGWTSPMFGEIAPSTPKFPTDNYKHQILVPAIAALGSRHISNSEELALQSNRRVANMFRTTMRNSKKLLQQTELHRSLTSPPLGSHYSYSK
jgi:hypothetical protein